MSPSMPSTPAGNKLSAWLTAFNSSLSDDASSQRTYNTQSFPYKIDRPEGEAPHDITADQVQMRVRTGGFDLLRVLTDEETKVAVVLKGRNSEGGVNEKCVTMEVESAEPHYVVRFLIDSVPEGKEAVLPPSAEA